jgi:hypothetical protein
MKRFAKVRLSPFQLEMVVITHQSVTAQPSPEPFGYAAQQLDGFFMATLRTESNLIGMSFDDSSPSRRELKIPV